MQTHRSIFLLLVTICMTSGAFGQDVARPPLMSEQLFSLRGGSAPNVNVLWSRALIELNIPGYTPRSDNSYIFDCNYANALDTLRKIRLEKTQAADYAAVNQTAGYAATWAENQVKVFSACEPSKAQDNPPLEPTGKGLPARAATDYAYQLASWNFYRGKLDAALVDFRRLEKNAAAPQRGNAAYMVARTLAYQQQHAEAYAQLVRIAADNSLKDVHAIATNYRFILMNNTNYRLRSAETPLPPELATQHLRWLHGQLLIDAEKAANPERAAVDYHDAKEQIANFFPLYEPDSKAVDWWLSEETPVSARMQAVKALAPELKLIDWMQARWAYNIFDTDWLWALHDASNPYWAQNRNIVAHAWGRWRTEHDGVWLEIAISRVHPHDALAQDILAAAKPFLAQLVDTKSRQLETSETKAWRLALFSSSLRLLLGAGQTQAAIDLIARVPADYYQPDYFDRLDTSFISARSGQLDSLARTLRWLVYSDQWDEARVALNAIHKHYPNGFKQWTALLATTAAQAHSAASSKLDSRYSYQVTYANDQGLWQAMLDDLSTQALHDIAQDSSIYPPYRALIARTVLTRALLLGFDDATVDKYAALAGKLNPTLREQILAGVADHNKNAYVSFLLKMPRFRLMPLLEYAPNMEALQSSLKSSELAPDAIDTHNPNDNNWWCKFDQRAIQNRVLKIAKITPFDGDFRWAKLFSESKSAAEIAPYLERQKFRLAQHPYRALVNAQEIQALSSLASAPQYLSEAVIAREGNAAQTLSATERNARAADLHRAVRTTRYGCNRNGFNSEYSYRAFVLLHKRYKDTPWAAATPFWFDWR